MAYGDFRGWRRGKVRRCLLVIFEDFRVIIFMGARKHIDREKLHGITRHCAVFANTLFLPMMKTFQHMLLMIDMEVCLLSSESSR